MQASINAHINTTVQIIGLVAVLLGAVWALSTAIESSAEEPIKKIEALDKKLTNVIVEDARREASQDAKIDMMAESVERLAKTTEKFIESSSTTSQKNVDSHNKLDLDLQRHKNEPH